MTPEKTVHLIGLGKMGAGIAARLKPKVQGVCLRQTSGDWPHRTFFLLKS